MKLFDLIQKTQVLLEQRTQEVTTHLPEVILHASLTAMRLHHEAIVKLTGAGHASACAPLILEQIQIRVGAILMCSNCAPFAVRILTWFEEMAHRLRFLHLEHLEAESGHLEILLSHCAKREEGDLIRQWFSQKPQPQSADESWLRNWPLWPLERFIFEVQKHLVTSPRIKKELDGFLDVTRDHASLSKFRGVKRFALIDEEVNRVTYRRDGEEPWSQGPLALSTVAILDTLADISQAFSLALEDEIDAQRVTL